MRATANAAQGALRAAGAIEGVIADLNNRLGRQRDSQVKIAVSIHAGRAAVGEIGSSEPPMLMAIGEAVDVANDLRKAAAERDKAFAISEKVYADAGLAPVPIRTASRSGRRRGDTSSYLSDAAPIPSPTLDAARRTRPRAPCCGGCGPGGRQPALELRRLVGVVPPGLGHAARVARLGVRLAEHVPVGDPVRRLVPARDPVVLRRAARDRARGRRYRGSGGRWPRPPCSISASTTGLAMPEKLGEPLPSADLLEK